MTLSPSFVVASAFFLLILLIWKKVSLFLREAFDNYIEKINGDINSAILSHKISSLRLEEAVKSKKEAIEQSKLILIKAENESISLKERISQEIENYKKSEELSFSKQIDRVVSDIQKELQMDLINLSIKRACYLFSLQSEGIKFYQNESLLKINEFAKNFSEKNLESRTI